MHFNDMKSDLADSVRQIANFLDIEPDAATFERIVAHCTIDYMMAHAEHAAPMGGIKWKDGARNFVNKGTNRCWRDTLDDEEVIAYEAKSLKELGPECANWLANGGLL